MNGKQEEKEKRKLRKLRIEIDNRELPEAEGEGLYQYV